MKQENKPTSIGVAIVYPRADGCLSVVHPTPGFVARVKAAEIDTATGAVKACLERFKKRSGKGLRDKQILAFLKDWVVPEDCRSKAQILPIGELPERDEFRDAWRLKSKRVRVDMPAARDLHMGRIRKRRDAELAKLDAPFMQAIERADAAEQARIGALKQALRDIPQTLDLKAAKTPAALKALWPAELPAAG